MLKKNTNSLGASLLKSTVVLAMMLMGCSASAIASSSTSDSETKTAKKTETDTIQPTITFISDSVTVEKGEKYSAQDNIKSVEDDIDGIVQYAKEATKATAYYIIDDSAVDTNKTGTYTVTVTAADKSGNTATKTFEVVVTDTTTKKEETTNAKNETATNTSTSSNKSSSKKNASASKSSSSSSSKTSSSNASSAASSNVSSSTSSSDTQAASTTQENSQQTEHVHDWVVTQTVHHDAETEQVPVYETVSVLDTEYLACNTCDFKLDCREYPDNTALAYAWDDHVFATNYTCASYHIEEKRHSEQRIKEYITKTIKPAYEEAVAFRCTTCGATK